MGSRLSSLTHPGRFGVRSVHVDACDEGSKFETRYVKKLLWKRIAPLSQFEAIDGSPARDVRELSGAG